MSKKHNLIRNFSIIAHIDHGKSTLADRLIEMTHTVASNEMTNQLLDNMDLERERGITIKAHAIRMIYNRPESEYILNMIDTPGHVDFSYEVSRSLAACEGAVLVVDASQGIEAQTLANLYLALENDLTIIPVINKIDLPNANVPKVTEELERVLEFKKEEIILCSGKTGEGVDKLLEAIVERIPAPKIENDKPTRALIFDSYFDSYRGVILLVKVEDGIINVGDTIELINTKSSFDVVSLGYHTPKMVETKFLESGSVGFIAASIKDLSKVS